YSFVAAFFASFRTALFSFCLVFSPPFSGILPVSCSLLAVVFALLFVCFLFLFDVRDEAMHRVFLHDFHTSLFALLPLFCIVLFLLLHLKWCSLYCQFPFLFQLVPLSFHIPFLFLMMLFLWLKLKLVLFEKEYFLQ